MAHRLFISFDFDNDADLKTMLAGQAKLPDSPFEFADASVKKHLTGDWEAKVRERIRRADQVAVLCGKHTATAEGVAIELAIAQELKKPYFLLAGYSSGGNKKPANALAEDKMYNWTWPNLKSLVAGNR